MRNFKDELNPQQYKVVTSGDGNCLVLAGAGSGKTRTLIYRIAYLAQKKIPLESILLVTFTNKAAQEMVQRAQQLLHKSLAHMWMGTFHHIAARILRRQCRIIDYSPNFSILDRQDTQDLIGSCIQEYNKSKDAVFPKKEIIAKIHSLSVNSQKSVPDIVTGRFSHLNSYIPAIEKILKNYQKKKKDANAMDFDDLLLNWLCLLDNTSLRRQYAQRFKYILVDEYQDTNRLQFLILKKLKQSDNNLLVVGDDAQSIYSFRAADINNILSFHRHFPATKTFQLQINYRSSPQILNLANNSIAHNKNQFPKHLTAVKPKGELPFLVKTADVYGQADFCVKIIRSYYERGVPLNNIAVLFRSRFQSLEVEMALIKETLPYVVRGGLRFFQQRHIKDVVSFLKITANPQDNLSFQRAACLYPAIGKKTAQKMFLRRQKENDKKIASSLPQKAASSGEKLFSLLSRLKNTPQPSGAIHAIVKTFYQQYCLMNFDNPQERLADLEELVNIASAYNNLNEFLHGVSLFEGFHSENKDSVVLSTIHQAKGLEWKVVILVGLIEGEFPHPKAVYEEGRLEEERRLFYVACTRAKDYLYLVYPQIKYNFRQAASESIPSVFIREIDPDCYQIYPTQQAVVEYSF